MTSMMTPAELKACRESMGLSDRWLGLRWGVKEHTVHNWGRNRIVPQEYADDLWALQDLWTEQVKKLIKEDADVILVPRVNSQADGGFPADWWRSIAWAAQKYTGARIRYTIDETDYTGYEDELGLTDDEA
ncbi:hypothetical protein [Bifidobacterium magnum]|uniref:Putative phage protein gp75 n=1 Tax=Bifidobacterium magnum TaxID=1692 RepID=A0A087B667_9BIFI|nr:hypothetical protein [Bifidobacterium magnum]KFI66517.1 putative phage protein gp75 [Bifidobacterium magnum]